MRIRTIKPEFWTSQSTNTVSVEAQLLAVGLLNYADDDGYFDPNPRLIKSAIFPLRDEIDHSRISTVLLPELYRSGYAKSGHATICEGDLVQVGFLPKFTTHQVINKPKASKYKDLEIVWDEYGTAPVVVPSGMEGNGTGKGREGIVADVTPPPPVDDKLKRQKFIPPTVEEVAAYIQEIQSSVSPESFVDHYLANGWMVGKAHMKDWRATVRKWSREPKLQRQPSSYDKGFAPGQKYHEDGPLVFTTPDGKKVTA